MTPTEALERAREDAKMGRVDRGPHARQRMKERNVQVEDVRRAMMSATKAAHDRENDTWKLTGGKDVDGDGLTVVVAFDPTRLVTTF